MTTSIYLSGGITNTNPAASLGGTQSTTVVPSSLFGPFYRSDFLAGKVVYRCIYVSTSEDVTNLRAWIATETTSTETSVAIGWGAAAINGTEPSIMTEISTPPGVTFTSPMESASGISGGNFTAGQRRAFWIRYTISAAATVQLLEQFAISFDQTEDVEFFLITEDGDSLTDEEGNPLTLED
jgi:hypothetical protein